MIEPLLTSSGNNSRLIMIEQQCDSDHYVCMVADYFDVYKYHGNNSRFDKGRLIGRIKAYVWHDVMEYVKKNLVVNESTNLNINCEKDFAFVEVKAQSTLTNDDNEGGGEIILSGYKIYLNKEGDESPRSKLLGFDCVCQIRPTCIVNCIQPLLAILLFLEVLFVFYF